MSLDFMVSTYPNEYNISCYDCYNGHILLLPTGGTGTFTYLWEDGPTTKDRFNLGEGSYTVTVTDGNQCIMRPERFYLSAPPRNDWTINGNVGTADTNQFIGTIDNTDLLLKTNNRTALRINAGGDVVFPNIQSGMLYLDETGKVKTSNVTPAGCAATNLPVWRSEASVGMLFTCPPHKVGIGDWNVPNHIKLKVEGNTWLNGKVGIGFDPVTINGPADYLLLVNGKMGAKEIYCSAGTPWPDYVFSDTYSLMSLQEVKAFISEKKHLPGIPSATELESTGINVYEQLSKAYEKIEELYLHLIALEERMRKMESGK
jgi:hypothetical protein